jgi:hypothetical protein
MSDGVIALHTRQHDASGVLADFQRILEEEPECASDGVVVIMLSRGDTGDRYDTTQLTSNMRYMEAVALLEAAKYDMIRKVMG